MFSPNLVKMVWVMAIKYLKIWHIPCQIPITFICGNTHLVPTLNWIFGIITTRRWGRCVLSTRGSRVWLFINSLLLGNEIRLNWLDMNIDAAWMFSLWSTTVPKSQLLFFKLGIPYPIFAPSNYCSTEYLHIPSIQFHSVNFSLLQPSKLIFNFVSLSESFSYPTGFILVENLVNIPFIKSIMNTLKGTTSKKWILGIVHFRLSSNLSRRYCWPLIEQFFSELILLHNFCFMIKSD